MGVIKDNRQLRLIFKLSENVSQRVMSFYSFPPDFITGNNSEAWYYGALAESWSTWLPKDTLSDIMRYYK
jgi:hypothetical protein